MKPRNRNQRNARSGRFGGTPWRCPCCKGLVRRRRTPLTLTEVQRALAQKQIAAERQCIRAGETV